MSEMNRRTLLGGALAGGTVLAGGALLAGCGSSSGGGGGGGGGSLTTGQTVAVGERRRGGTFRYAGADASSDDSTDPHSATGNSWALNTAWSNTLVSQDPEQKPVLTLAEEFAPDGKDQRVWTIRVKDGVEFHDGKTLDADDVIFSIRRILDPKNPGFSAGLFIGVDPRNGLKKLDSRTVRLTLTTPNSRLMEPFWQVPSAIVPVGFDPRRPVGTGPFRHHSYTPGQRWVGVRNENFFVDNRPFLDRLELLTFDDPQVARVNALLSGQIDGMDQVQPAQLAQVRGRSELQAIVSRTGAFEPIALRSGRGDLFEDPRTRLAMKLILDRRQLLNAIYGGYGELGNDVGAPFDPAYDSSIPQRQQDLEQARALLKAVGKEGLTVSFRVGEVVPGQVESAQVIQQEAKKAGVNIKVDVLGDLAQFYSAESYVTSQMKNDYLYTQTLYELISYCYGTNAAYNNTGYGNARLDSLFRQALGSTEERYVELMHEASQLLHEDGPWMVWGHHNIVDAFNRKFTGITPDAGGNTMGGGRWEEIGLVA